MPAAREDYLIRLLQQVSAVLRRLRERLTGATDSGAEVAPGELASIGREAADAVAALLGPQAALLQQLDASSAVALVADAERVALWVGLLEVQAAAARAEGQAARAAQVAARAMTLAEAAARRWPDARGAS